MRLLIAMFWLLIGGAALAQPGSPAEAGLPPLLSHIFADHAGFTARTLVQLEGKSNKDAMQLPMQFYYREGNIRAEIDMAQVESVVMPADLVQTLRQVGMDKVTTIIRKMDGVRLVLYPNLKACVELKEAGALGEEKPIKEVKVGEETVDGQPCEKFRIIEQGETDGTISTFVWRSKGLKMFPVKVEMKQPGKTAVFHYSRVILEKPDPKLFVRPENYKTYKDLNAVMKAALERLLGGEDK